MKPEYLSCLRYLRAAGQLKKIDANNAKILLHVTLLIAYRRLKVNDISLRADNAQSTGEIDYFHARMLQAINMQN